MAYAGHVSGGGGRGRFGGAGLGSSWATVLMSHAVATVASLCHPVVQTSSVLDAASRHPLLPLQWTSRMKTMKMKKILRLLERYVFFLVDTSAKLVYAWICVQHFSSSYKYASIKVVLMIC